ncbi:hypothetical protein AAVH_25655 [Aphelenchoides avenae]|nr:hypothetical protein AAVH_25655 [Aphelenchus avenae]
MSHHSLTCSLLELPWFKDGAPCEFGAQGVGLLLVEDDKVIVIKQKFPLCINRVAAGSFVAEFVRAALRQRSPLAAFGYTHLERIGRAMTETAISASTLSFAGTTAIIWLPSEMGSRFGAFAEALSAYAAIRSIGSTTHNLDPDVINANYNAILSDDRG